MTKKFRYLNPLKEPLIRPPRMPSEDKIDEARRWLAGSVGGEPMGLEFLNTVCEAIVCGYQHTLRGDMDVAKEALSIAIAMARRMDASLRFHKFEREGKEIPQHLQDPDDKAHENHDT